MQERGSTTTTTVDIVRTRNTQFVQHTFLPSCSTPLPNCAHRPPTPHPHIKPPVRISHYMAAMSKAKAATSSSTDYATSASQTAETWKAFFNMGVIFPLHLVLGISCFPVWMYYLVTGSVKMWVFALCYLPIYLYPAQNQYPGWKGFEALWTLMDYVSRAGAAARRVCDHSVFVS